MSALNLSSSSDGTIRRFRRKWTGGGVWAWRLLRELLLSKTRTGLSILMSTVCRYLPHQPQLIAPLLIMCHQHSASPQESYLAPKFRQIVEECRSRDAGEDGLSGFLEEEAAVRVYRFPVFERGFCEELVEELEHFEQSSAPKGRPNTMNHYGILLNELGFDEGFITPLREYYLHPLTSLLYPDCGGRCLDSHKAFVVKYDMNEDLDLSYHYDNAEVTLNVSLGKDFTEGNLYFGDMRQVPLSETECTEVEHRVTEGVLHRGQHMHGALPISSGQRWNLIIWMRGSRERNKLCPMCNRRPTLVEGEGFADGFTKHSDAPLNTSCVLT
ncbi:2-oxoglutarate and iron-dependent oxygenase domain-containing protein 2 isoform X3 [Enoplosus armatus]|uniref:2-oxoglutarate and iron-dependent oxygenase domain-containing protein 2 isoform X3 n=1 Tax=Enoplosus armatus TaxID=215367 RepID=UPI0039926DE1